MIKKRIFCLIILLFTISSTVHAELFVYHDKATDLFGFKDANNDIIIPPQFERILVPEGQKLFSPEDEETQFLVPVVKKGKVWRMTPDGTLKFESVFFDNGADYYEDGLARFLEKGKVGFHDREGHVVIQPIYDFASPFRDGYANVCNGCHGEYSHKLMCRPLTSGGDLMEYDQHPIPLLDVVGGEWGMIDTKGNVVIPLIYDSFEEMLKKDRKLPSNNEPK